MGVETAILGGAVVGGGLSWLGAKEQSNAAKKASKSQRKGADAATQAELEMYYQSREDLAPWREAGVRSLEDLERLQGTYEDVIMDPNKYIQSPSYNFLLDRGVDAIDRGASATGKLDSGQRSKDLMEFGQGLASRDYEGYVSRIGNLLNRYAGTSGVGQSATTTTAGLGANAANSIGANSLYAGQADANRYINQANAQTGLYENIANIGSNATNQLFLNNYLNRKPGLTSQYPNVPTIRGGYGGGYGF